MRPSRPLARIVAVSSAAVAAIGLTASAAWAHVEADPSRVKPGEEATVGFTPEHGCDDSPIVEMRFRIPKGATDVSAVPKDGWEATATKKTVTFSGGEMPSDDTDAFEITFTAPGKKGELTWKIVQTCEEGVERWIQGPDDELPAPVVGVGKDVESHEEEDEH